MPLDFSKLSSNQSFDTSTNPRDLFVLMPNKAKTNYKYLRDFQTEVLNKWNESKDSNSEFIIKMNTGSGKTLVGLLILKACLNEGIGPAVFVVTDKFLESQVLSVCKDIGLSATDDPQSHRFASGKEILITNIHRIFNGVSVFGTQETGSKISIGTILIDDAHTCIEIINQKFTLTIDNVDTTKNIYSEILETFRKDLFKQSQTKLMDIDTQFPWVNMQVPFWSWNENLPKITKLLHENRKLEKLKYTYPLIMDNLHLSRCVISGQSIEISPHFPVIDSIPSFVKAKRKIIMSATINDDSILINSLNISKKSVENPITPEYSNDIGDRMILAPQDLNKSLTESDLRRYFKELSRFYNVIILIPSFDRLKFWKESSDLVLSSENISEGIESLKKGHIGLTVIVNRYDGIDLPEDACRILVIDGLPTYDRKIDKIEQQYLQDSNYTISKLIQRVEQGMGRGIRSNDDQCIVFLMGNQLLSNLFVNAAKNYFTPATKAQIDLSERVADQLRDLPLENLTEIIKYSLDRNPEWVSQAKSALLDIKYKTANILNEWDIARREAFNYAEHNQFEDSIKILNKCINETEDKLLKGFLTQNLAEYFNFKDPVEAQRILLSANGLNKNLMKPIEGIRYEKSNKFTGDQTINLKTYVQKKYPDLSNIILDVNKLIDWLKFEIDTAPNFELGIHELGKLIGFNSERPELETGRGPDNLWQVEATSFFVIECKNGSTVEKISKSDCNQINGSISWFQSEYGDSFSYTPILIHNSSVFTYESSPNNKIRIIDPVSLSKLTENLLKFAKVISQAGVIEDNKKISNYLINFNFRYDLFVNTYTKPFKKTT